MPECVMPIASAEIPPGKRCDFSWPRLRVKYRQRTNINNTLCRSQGSLSELKSKQVLHPIIGLGLSVS